MSPYVTLLDPYIKAESRPIIIMESFAEKFTVVSRSVLTYFTRVDFCTGAAGTVSSESPTVSVAITAGTTVSGTIANESSDTSCAAPGRDHIDRQQTAATTAIIYRMRYLKGVFFGY